jgi:hypothetical protein
MVPQNSKLGVLVLTIFFNSTTFGLGLKRGFASLIYMYPTRSSKVEHFMDVKFYNKLKTENYESTHQVLHQINFKNCVSIKILQKN